MGKLDTPELRFPEFEGEWIFRNLGNISDVRTGPFGSVLHQKDYVDIGTPIITVEHLSDYGILHTNLPLVSDYDKERLKSYILGKDDIVFSRVGSVDRNTLISKREEGWLFSGRLLRVRLDNQYNAKFVSLYFQKDKSKHQIRKIAVGQTMPSINTEILKSILICTPGHKEQQKIASFFTSIDKKIELLKKKHSLLEQYKKGVMQKIFAQKIRFKDSDGNDYADWEEKKLGEVFDVTRGNVLAVNKLKQAPCNEYKYPVYSSQTKNNGLLGYFNEYIYENAITWTTDGANAGAVKFRKGKFYCTNVSGVLINHKGNANQAIAEILNRITKRYVSYVGNPKLMNNVMAIIKIEFPHVAEQTKIANFLSAIDKKIEKVQLQIDKAEEWKKGLLGRMFC